MRTVKAKGAVEEETAEIERAHDSLLKERLEKKYDWPEELERRGVLLDKIYDLTLMEPNDLVSPICGYQACARGIYRYRLR